MNVRRSRSYIEKRRIWKIKQKWLEKHEAYKQYRIEQFDKEKMSERRRRDQESRRLSRRRSRSHSRSRSSDRRSRHVRLSPTQLETLTDNIRNEILSRIGANISEGPADRRSSARTEDRRSPRTNSTHSRNRPRSSRDRRDHEPSTSGRHLDGESSRPPRSTTDRQCSSTEHRRTTQERPAPARTQSPALVPSRPPAQDHAPAQSPPRSPIRDRDRHRSRRCELCNQHHSSRDRNAPCTTRPNDGRYPPHPQDINRPPREYRDPHRWYQIEQQPWPRNIRPYPNYPRGPAPYPMIHNLPWSDIPPEHLGYPWIPPPPRQPPYRVPYPPHGPGPNYRGYH